MSPLSSQDCVSLKERFFRKLLLKGLEVKDNLNTIYISFNISHLIIYVYAQACTYTYTLQTFCVPLFVVLKTLSCMPNSILNCEASQTYPKDLISVTILPYAFHISV